MKDRHVSRVYSDFAAPNVPPLQRERCEKVLAWLRNDMGPMTAAKILLCAHQIYGAGDHLEVALTVSGPRSWVHLL